MSQFNPAQTIEVIHGEGEPDCAIIWLHGLGASADDFPPVVPHLGLKKDLTIRFVFPQAPSRPITINGGAVMPGWYDIKGMTIKDKEDLEGMMASKTILDELIDQQIALGISSEKIIVAGFSQGGAVAYYAGLRSVHKLGGILALSTYMPFAAETQSQLNEINKKIPIMAMHGTHDPVLPIAMGKGSVDVLTGLGYSVEWEFYPMEHNVIPEQLVDIGQWINRVL